MAQRIAGPCFIYRFAVPLTRGPLLAFSPQFLNRFLDPFNHVEPGLVPIEPSGDRFGILREGLQPAEGCPFPISGTNDYGDHSCFASLLPLYRLADLLLIDVIRGHEGSADEQEDYVCGP